MKKLKRIVPLVMAGAMLVSPVSMSTQAKVTNNVEDNLYSTQTVWNGSINADNVNVRRGPSISSASLGQVHTGTNVFKSNPVHDAGGRTWYYCKTEGGPSGYIAGEFIS